MYFILQNFKIYLKFKLFYLNFYMFFNILLLNFEWRRWRNFLNFNFIYQKKIKIYKNFFENIYE